MFWYIRLYVGVSMRDHIADQDESNTAACIHTDAVRERGSTVEKVITIVDRLHGAKENLKKHGIELIPLFIADADTFPKLASKIQA